jgi:hypothetical protein
MQMRSMPMIAAAFVVLTAASAEAQEWKPLPASFTNGRGLKITETTVRVTDHVCMGSARYMKVSDPAIAGVAVLEWPNLSKQDGGVLCSGGYWSVTTGGTEYRHSTTDLLVRSGRLYRRS